MRQKFKQLINKVKNISPEQFQALIQITIAIIMLSSVLVALRTTQAARETATIMKKEAAFLKRPIIKIYKSIREWGAYDLSIKKIVRGDKLVNAICFNQFFIVRNTGSGPAYVKYIGAILEYKGKTSHKFYKEYDNLSLESEYEGEESIQMRQRLEPVSFRDTLMKVADYENGIIFPIEDYKPRDIIFAAKIEYADYLGNVFHGYSILGLANRVDKEDVVITGIDRDREGALEYEDNWRWWNYQYSESASALIDEIKSKLDMEFPLKSREKTTVESEKVSGLIEIVIDKIQPLEKGIDKTKPPEFIKIVEPIYPESALKMRVEGVVTLEVITDIDGRVEKIKVVRSVPLLYQAAIDAVRQWVYEPMIIDDKPKEIINKVTFRFKLKDQEKESED